jgi:Raf kinase inhibitor-like YbhB/YbcL family protein
MMSLTITSHAFTEGGAIPRRHTCDGENLSPPLEWVGVPDGASSLALIVDDPDAPAGVWVHWVLWNIPADRSALFEANRGGGVEGSNDFRRTGYGGPCPPRGATHRYFFKLYALDTSLNLKPGASKRDLERAMQGHILAEGRLMGVYRRG